MTSNKFIVSEIVELRVLHRVFREAKFCVESDDLEISDSPIVARMFERLVATLIARDVALDGEHAGQRWKDWLVINESRDEWRVAVRRAKAYPNWATFSVNERTNYVKDLLSPFTLSPDTIEKFVLEVNRS